MSFAVDASAVLCVLLGEAGADEAARLMRFGEISAVNLAEVVSRLSDAGIDDLDPARIAAQLDLVPRIFDAAQARIVGTLRRTTRAYGLSLGDRACLALAHATGKAALTADRAWAALDIGIEVRLVR